MNFEIKSVKAREVLDSRGNPTVEVEMTTGAGFVTAMVPSGASTGVHEAHELRDNDERYGGKGVMKAVSNVNNEIAKEVTGMDCQNQRKIDEMMIQLDATENKSRLGANAILAVSMAATRAAAQCQGIPLYKYVSNISGLGPMCMPVPQMNVINGGRHAGNALDIQEYMILPVGTPNIKEAVRMGSEIYHVLRKELKDKFGKDAINVGDEGGFAPPLSEPHEPLELLVEAIEAAGYAGKAKLAMDCAASGFYKDGSYVINGKKMSGSELSDLYATLMDNYPLISIEDPFAEDDWVSWAEFTGKYNEKIQIVGDDLLVTNVDRIRKAMERKACNALLLKINQIGTVSESIDAAKASVEAGWNVVVSHRSGETEDSFIADLVVGLGVGQLKAGAPCRSDRNAKYNQLMRIGEQIEKECGYAGKSMMKN